MTTMRTAEGRESGGFSYFMIRLHHEASESAGDVAGIVERLGTGEKRTFANGRELVALVSGWPALMPPGAAKVAE